MKKYISKFHYITHDLPQRSHVEQAEAACRSGANWIQYRCLTKTDEELIIEINKIAAICDDWGATLILCNHYHLLNEVDAQGVHIEDMNADLAAIRKQTGDDKTLGASANTFEDIRRISSAHVVDYIGCGPFSVTRTKPNTYPLLGTGGYRDVLAAMEEQQINIPVIAIGGIQAGDVEALLTAGVYGIAVAGAVNFADDPEKAVKHFCRSIF